MAYTTVENVERRLQGWATTGAPLALGETPVDTALIQQLIDQAGGDIDRCLSDRYVLPLTGTYLDLEGLAEKIVLCQLIGQLYAGQDPSESGGYGALMCQQAAAGLKALKTLDFPSETGIGSEAAIPSSGVRSLPSVYTRNCTDGPTVQKIDPVRW